MGPLHDVSGFAEAEGAPHWSLQHRRSALNACPCSAATLLWQAAAFSIRLHSFSALSAMPEYRKPPSSPQALNARVEVPQLHLLEQAAFL